MSIHRRIRRLQTYLSSAWYGRKQRQAFDAVAAYCMFIGYPRTGHSLIGSLLDAHPSITMAHELDALDYLNRGYRRNQLFHLIVRNSEQFSAAGRFYTGYSYKVPNQWQGRSRQLRVIGDKMGGRSTLRLVDNPQLVDRLRLTIVKPLKIVHVTRNPFDVIATMTRRNQRTQPTRAIETFFKFCRGNAMIKKIVPEQEIFDIRLEDFINMPTQGLDKLCTFLGVEPTPGYLDDCASIVFKSPKKSRFDIDWSANDVEQVITGMAQFEFLSGYRFDETTIETGQRGLHDLRSPPDR